jgi:hypothetical protein
VAFLSPALMPGKTLSNSDTLWFEPPWVASKPAELDVPSNPDLNDATRYLQPFLRRTMQEMPEVPLWNPWIMGGRPYHANAQTAAFGPYTLPAYILTFWTALSWIGVLKLWVAAFGTFLLARALNMRFAGALFAGIVYALSLKMVTWLIYPAMGVWTWIPWLLFLTDRVTRRPDLLSGGALAAVIAIQFLTGHAESSFHALLAAIAFLALRLWQARSATASVHRRLGRPLLAFGGAVVAGTALAAVSLIPFGELLWLSADIVDRSGASVDLSLPVEEAIGVFLPDFWGRPTQTPIRPIMLERALYVGALPLMLAAVALVVRPTAERICVALFGGLWFAVVLGIPPFLQIITRLPLFNSGHNSRLIILSVLAIALLAGWGLDDLASRVRTSPYRRRVALGAAGLLFMIPVAVLAVRGYLAPGAFPEAFRIAWLFADPPGQFRDPQGVEVIRLSSLIVWVTVAGAGLTLLAFRLSGRMRASLFVALALLVLCVDLFRVGMGLNPAIDKEVADVPATGAIRVLQQQRPARFVSTEEFPQNVIAMKFGLQEARGYDLPIVRRFDRFWRQEVIPRTGNVAAGFIDIPLRFMGVTPRSLRAMRLLGVRNILVPKSLWPSDPPFDRLQPAPPVDEAGLTPVYDGPDARVYRVEAPLPRAFVVGAQRVVDGEDAALDAISRPGFDPRRVAITETRLSGLPGSRDADTGSRGSSARIARYEPERVVVRVRSSGAALLVLTDNHYPGWKAEVDGREVPVDRVDYMFRGVRVGPGAHTVEFRYEPLSWRIGWIVSLVALGGLILAVAVGWRRRRNLTSSASGRSMLSPSAGLAVVEEPDRVDRKPVQADRGEDNQRRLRGQPVAAEPKRDRGRETRHDEHR